MATSSSPEGQNGSFFSKFSSAISAAYKKFVGSFESQIRTGKTAVEMPSIPIIPFQKSVMACCTGPYGGICQLQADLDAPTHEPGAEIAGVTYWHRPQPQADGQSITLYEHKLHSPQHHGDPIADVFAVVARPNSCILVVADGVNWGIKPRLAARCAVHGCIDHLNSKLFDCPKMPGTTQDVIHNMLRSLHTAQKRIIEHGGTTTTLCVAVVVELAEPRGNNRWGLCVVCVGDTLCYVWRNEEQEVHEITSAMHRGKERNPRDSGGCLGADLGDNPDLSNLCCCFVPIADADIVFVASDGVSDNFDPVILKEAVSSDVFHSSIPTTPPPYASAPPFPPLDQQAPPGPNCKTAPQLPYIAPEQRQTAAMMKMTHALKEKWQETRRLTASDVKDALVNHVIEVSEEKRKYLEQRWKETAGQEQTQAQKRAQERKISVHMKQLPGKLDHATIAAYRVGRLYSAETGLKTGHSPTHSHHMNTAVMEGSPIDRRRAETYSAAGGSIFYQANSKREKSGPI